MSTYVKVRDIIDTVRRFHRQLKVYYARLAKQVDKKRVQILLDYLSRKEQQFQNGLATYDEEGAGRLLDTWLQYGPDEKQLDVPSFGDFRPDMTVDDVEKTAMEFGKALTEFCMSASRLAKTDDVRRLFRSLAQQEQEEKANIKTTGSAVKRDM